MWFFSPSHLTLFTKLWGGTYTIPPLVAFQVAFHPVTWHHWHQFTAYVGIIAPFCKRTTFVLTTWLTVGKQFHIYIYIYINNLLIFLRSFVWRSSQDSCMVHMVLSCMQEESQRRLGDPQSSYSFADIQSLYILRVHFLPDRLADKEGLRLRWS